MSSKCKKRSKSTFTFRDKRRSMLTRRNCVLLWLLAETAVQSFMFAAMNYNKFSLNSELICPPNSHYSSCMSACPRTCSDSRGLVCQESCVEGCDCNEGFVLSGTECVPRSQCGCTHESKYYKVNLLSNCLTFKSMKIQCKRQALAEGKTTSLTACAHKFQIARWYVVCSAFATNTTQVLATDSWYLRQDLVHRLFPNFCRTGKLSIPGGARKNAHVAKEGRHVHPQDVRAESAAARTSRGGRLVSRQVRFTGRQQKFVWGFFHKKMLPY